MCPSGSLLAVAGPRLDVAGSLQGISEVVWSQVSLNARVDAQIPGGPDTFSGARFKNAGVAQTMPPGHTFGTFGAAHMGTDAAWLLPPSTGVGL